MGFFAGKCGTDNDDDTQHSPVQYMGVFGKGQSNPEHIFTTCNICQKKLTSETCAVSSIFFCFIGKVMAKNIYVLRLIDLLQITTPIDHGTPKKYKRIACNKVHY